MMGSGYEEELRKKWNALQFPEGGYLRVRVEHLLEWNVGRSVAGEKALVIISQEPLDKLPSSRSIYAKCGKRADGRYAISFLLKDSRQEDVFLTMGSDLIGYSSKGKNETDALRLVGMRYGQWCRLLAKKGKGRLTEAERKGLVGELLFLRRELVQREAVSAVDGWRGPEDGDQDFVYVDSWYEVKTTGKAAANITISSIEQLDADGPGELAVVYVDACAPAQPGAFTLPELIKCIADELEANPGASAFFEEKLEKAGYIELSEYNEEYWVFDGCRLYMVNDTFPRLRRRDLPSEIAACSYTLSLPGIAAWMKQG